MLAGDGYWQGRRYGGSPFQQWVDARLFYRRRRVFVLHTYTIGYIIHRVKDRPTNMNLTEKKPVNRFHNLLTEGELGCLMLDLPPSDAFKVIKFNEENIPEASLAPDGREREVHITVAYGFLNTVPADEVRALITEPIQISLGKISRFRNQTDVIKVEVISPGLERLHYALRDHFGPRLEISYKDFTPHLTLAYVVSGECMEVDGSDYFSGQRYVGKDFTYSSPSRSKKVRFSV